MTIGVVGRFHFCVNFQYSFPVWKSLTAYSTVGHGKSCPLVQSVPGTNLPIGYSSAYIHSSSSRWKQRHSFGFERFTSANFAVRVSFKNYCRIFSILFIKSSVLMFQYISISVGNKQTDNGVGVQAVFFASSSSIFKRNDNLFAKFKLTSDSVYQFRLCSDVVI